MAQYSPDIEMIDTMPRGGPDASWLDRRLQTGRLEYLDRDDAQRRQRVVAFLDRVSTLFNDYDRNAHLVVGQLDGLRNPRVLELGAGHGGLAARVLDLHATATVTVTDLDPKSVAAIEAGPLGAHPRAIARVVDATAIDAPDRSYDLVVLAMTLHHLPPGLACRAIAEATRVGRRFLVLDVIRPPAIALAVVPVLTLLPMVLIVLIFSSPFAVLPILHDAYISVLRSYSRSAFIALGRAAGPAITVEFLATRGQAAVLYIKPPNVHLTGHMFARTGQLWLAVGDDTGPGRAM
ncbi:class I SAM-dependent methyltransferase [Nocardia stercoris]|uniref:Class I SAM-dependent methyltransferase n=1 Tax=Nocardia stercoris TaxID=2483361 RepID=A0A3M2L3I9_9NOCA|nr:class I SAM-dependent methyltransferase [Nocardia stercoris]RMI32111.1 class I SAM-dependent methyltransferase [Nocardia stercoris]